MLHNSLKTKKCTLKIVGLIILSLFLWSDKAEAAALIKPANTLGLEGWWKFDEGSGATTTDSAKNGNTGVFQNMGNEDWIDGVFLTALDLNGSDEYVIAGSDSSLNPTNAMTFTGWVYMRSFGAGFPALIERLYGTSYLLYLGSLANSIFMDIQGVSCESNSNVVNTGRWIHVAVTYDGDEVVFYTDAEESGVCNSTGVMGSDGNDVKIGNDDSLSLPFDGYIDDFRVYSRVLSQSEIQEVMNGDRVAYLSTTPEPSGTLKNGLIDYWTFDGRDTNWGTGAVTDKSGGDNTGYVVNMSTTSSPTDGRLGQAFVFDGTDDRITANGNNAVSSFSVAAWLYISGSPNQNRFLMNGRGGLHGWGIGLGDADGEFRFTKSSVVDLDLDIGSWPTGWNHYVWVVGSDYGVTLYINGVSQGSYGDTQAIVANSSGSFAIGCDLNSSATPNSFWNGMIDDVRIWSRTLPVDEIYKLYESGQATHNVSSSGGSNLENGLIGWWTLDGKDVNWGSGRVSDRSGQGNHGYVVGLSTTSTPVSGKSGQGFYLDGVGQSVVFPTNPSPVEGLSYITASVWANITDLSGTTQNIFEQEGGGGDPILIRYSAGTGLNDFRFECVIDTINDIDVAVFSDSRYTSEGWRHVVCTYDGSEVNLYVDGQVADLTPGAATGILANDPSNNRLNIVGSDTLSFTGPVDDVRIWNRALSASEIRELYDGGR